jgi:hypothetical protein
MGGTEARGPEFNDKLRVIDRTTIIRLFKNAQVPGRLNAKARPYFDNVPKSDVTKRT